MSTSRERPCYMSYLLRMWQTRDGEKQVWRASLESPGIGERRGFASLQDLFDFLDARTGSADDPDESFDF